jgi:Glycosyltransferase family 87
VQGRGSRASQTAAGDALLYIGSAAFALSLLRFSPFVKYRAWASFAAPTYAAAALGAVAVAVVTERSRQTLARARLLITFVVLVGTLAVPLAAEVSWRAERGASYAPSEVVVTEVAARALVHGHDPYSVALTSPELVGRQPSIARHFPYLPGMVLFGLPRTLLPGTRWGDARVWIALATVIATAAALCRWRASLELRLRLLQVLLIPVGAAVLVAGGDDVPVLALCLCALVLFSRGKRAGSAAAIGLAALLKLTAWPLLAAMAIGGTVRNPKGPRAVALVVAPIVVLAGVAACVAAGAAAFADDVLLYPFGLTSPPSPAATTTLGTFIVDKLTAAPFVLGHRAAIATVIAIGFAISAAIMCALLRVCKLRPVGAAEIAAAAGAILAVLVVLAPQARLGYLIYPLDLLAWAALMRTRQPVAAQAEAPVHPLHEPSEGFAW